MINRKEQTLAIENQLISAGANLGKTEFSDDSREITVFNYGGSVRR
jgi:hypothetical protein